MAFNVPKLIDDLILDEGKKPGVYDDKNGRTIERGVYVFGNPTTGIGHALNRKPWTDEQMRVICAWDIADDTKDLYARMPWLADRPEPMQRALANMVFNMGLDGLLKLGRFLLLLHNDDVEGACDDLGTTLWAREVGPERVGRIIALLKESA